MTTAPGAPPEQPGGADAAPAAAGKRIKQDVKRALAAMRQRDVACADVPAILFAEEVGQRFEKTGLTLRRIIIGQTADQAPVGDEFTHDLIDNLRDPGYLGRVTTTQHHGARLGKTLGEIMHPPVIAEMVRRTEQGVQDRHPLVVLDIPLLFEGKQAGTGSAVAFDYDALVAVWVPRQLQIHRTMARDGCDEAEAERRVNAQLDIDEKRVHHH